MARAPFTYPFCYTPAPDIVAAARRLITYLDTLQPNGSGGPENFALRAHPPQPDGWVPPVHEATGGHGFAGVNPAAEQAEVVFWAQNWRKGGLQPRRNEIIREQGFYNQTWCGCEFSRNQTPKTP